MNKVLKFGGTSVGSANNMRKVASIITDELSKVTVLSAMSGTTDSLIKISTLIKSGEDYTPVLDAIYTKYSTAIEELLKSKEEALNQLNKAIAFIKEEAKSYNGPVSANAILARGELLTSAIFTMYMQECGKKAELINILDFMHTTKDGAVDTRLLATKLNEYIGRFDADTFFITQGFICTDSSGHINNLGRGGSDYSAALIGAAIDGREVQIWTDIDGMHNNDPRYVEGTYPIRTMSFDEAAELAYFGAKILHPATIQPCKERSITVKLKNTLDPKAEGTSITNIGDSTKQYHAVAAKDNITVIRVCSARMLLAFGFLTRVFEIFEKYRTPIDMITTSEVAVSLTIDNDEHLSQITEELSHLGTITVEHNSTIICVVGKIEHERSGLVARILSSIDNIPVKMVSYGASMRSVAILINAQDKIKTLRQLNSHLFQ